MKKNFLPIFLVINLFSFYSVTLGQTCPSFSSYNAGGTPNSSDYGPGITVSPHANSVPYTGQTCTSYTNFYSFNACTGTTYMYQMFFNGPAPVSGFNLNVVGGQITNALFYRPAGTTNFASPSLVYPLTGDHQIGGGTQPQDYVTELQVSVQWTTVSTSNSLQIYGYNPSSVLNMFSALTVNTSNYPTTPAAPTAVELGAPVCSLPGWEVDAISTGSNPYYWTYKPGTENYGSQMGIYPNSAYPYAYGPSILNNNSYAVTAYFCVYSVGIANSCAAAPNSAQYCNPSGQGVSIPPGSTACTHGYSIKKGKEFAHSTDSDSSDIAIPSDDDRKLPHENMVYPNPTHNVVNVYFDKPANHYVELISVTGQVCKKMDGILADQLQIDVSQLSKGVYIVLIYENHIVVSRKKIIVQ